jgi:hypothetical protein
MKKRKKFSSCEGETVVTVTKSDERVSQPMRDPTVVGRGQILKPSNFKLVWKNPSLDTILMPAYVTTLIGIIFNHLDHVIK